MVDTFNMTNTMLKSFIQRKKSANKSVLEISKNVARDVVPESLHMRKGQKDSCQKTANSDVVGAQLLIQQALSQ